ncbi:MAG: 16S rRNA (uracil(1498)-N(3))-methyltransferase [Cyanobacteriota bacterium]
MQRITVESSQFCDRTLTLNRQQLHYLMRVLRLQGGDRFVAMDGSGSCWETELVEGEEGPYGRVVLALDFNRELPISLTLLAGLPKGQGFDEVVRQTTELGVTRVIPVLSDRTLLKPSPNKLQRWQRIATEAAEQSERQWVPMVERPMSLAEAIAAVGLARTYFCVARGDRPHLLRQVRQDVASWGPEMAEMAIAIGPEGGWTTAEVEVAIAAGWQGVSLGQRILRAVTAPTVALALVGAALESGLD